MKTVVGLLIIAAACVLFLTGLAKVFDPEPFREALRAQDIVPAASISVASGLFPWLEVSVAAGVLWWSTQRSTLGYSLLCLAVFLGMVAVYLTVLWIHPPAEPAPCGCGFSNKPVENWGVRAAGTWGSALAFVGDGRLFTTRQAEPSRPAGNTGTSQPSDLGDPA